MTNERILEAAFQAEFINKLVRDDSYFIDNPKLMVKLDKFAEIIIRECAEAASDYDGSYLVGTFVKKHFGIEE